MHNHTLTNNIIDPISQLTEQLQTYPPDFYWMAVAILALAVLCIPLSVAMRPAEAGLCGFMALAMLGGSTLATYSTDQKEAQSKAVLIENLINNPSTTILSAEADNKGVITAKIGIPAEVVKIKRNILGKDVIVEQITAPEKSVVLHNKEIEILSKNGVSLAKDILKSTTAIARK